jgi:hypothetical protein
MIEIPEVRSVNINEIEEDINNPNEMSEAQLEGLIKSIKRFGFLVPIITNSALKIADGHQRLTAAKHLGMQTVPTIILNVTEVDRLMIQQVMNKLKGQHDDGMDAEVFRKLAEADQLEDLSKLLAVDVKEFGGFNEGDFEGGENIYTKKIKIPVYEPSGDKPAKSELFDDVKTKALVEYIESLGLDDEVKAFLVLAAQRFTVFNYDKIAEYYAHSSSDVQEVMEKLALVIIDYDKAIENGFIRLSEDVANKFIEAIEND